MLKNAYFSGKNVKVASASRQIASANGDSGAEPPNPRLPPVARCSAHRPLCCHARLLLQLCRVRFYQI